MRVALTFRKVPERLDPQGDGYDTSAKLLHWSTVALVLGQFCFAFAMSASGQDQTPDRAAALHISTGILVLSITLVRVARIPRPTRPIAGIAPWERYCARTVHLLLYGLLISLALSGILATYSRGWPVRLFGIPILPKISGAHPLLAPVAATAHSVVIVCFLCIVGIHLLGVCYHIFLRADGVIDRMLPDFSGMFGRPASRAETRHGEYAQAHASDHELHS